MKYLVPVPDELYGPVRQKEPDGPHDGEGWEGEVLLLLLLLVAHCCKHSTICHVTIWSGDFNASTFCGGLEIGNNCTVMKHSKPRLVMVVVEATGCLFVPVQTSPPAGENSARRLN